LFGSLASKAKAVNEKHDLTGKASAGVVKGMDKLSGAMEPKKK
jgi:hypothetical protein